MPKCALPEALNAWLCPTLTQSLCGSPGPHLSLREQLPLSWDRVSAGPIYSRLFSLPLPEGPTLSCHSLHTFL